MKRMAKAEITVFLSLAFLLLLILIGAVIESASIQIGKNEKRADASRAIESIFAEFQRDLMEQYGIFAIDGSYESDDMSEKNVLNRLSFYGAENMEMKIDAIRYLTDDFGKEFYRQAVMFQKCKTGISFIEELTERQESWKEIKKVSELYETEDEKIKIELEQVFESDEQNPMKLLELMKTELFLKMLLPKDFSLSEQAAQNENMISKRKKREGYGSLYEKEESAEDAVLFNLYIMDHFGYAIQPKEHSYMKYELEYLLGGKSTDKANLESVLQKICGIRFGGNYAYLLTDQEKMSEAEVMAEFIAVLIASPEFVSAIKQGLLITWAYGEAIMDTKLLLRGEKIAIVKNKENWKLSLENIFDLKDKGFPESKEEKNGTFGYQDYVQMLLLTKNKKELSMRALDLVEKNISLQEGKDYFKMDQCITGLKIQVNCFMRRNIKYHFVVSYQYR